MATRVTPTPGVTADGWVSLGVIARAHGIKGALRVHLWHDDSEVLAAAFEQGLEVRIGTRVWRVKSYASDILVLDGLTDRNAAELLQGKELLVRRADFPEDEESQYLVDLVGARVEDESGRLLGEVAGFSDNGAQALLEVRTPTRAEVLVPFVDPIVVSADEGVVVLKPPPGLFDDDAIIDEPVDDAARADQDDADDDE